MRVARRMLVVLSVPILLLGLVSAILAGSSLDYGTVPGTPPIGSVNWTTWLNKTVGAGGYPSEVMTEDGTSPGLGEDQGYQDFSSAPNPKWLAQIQQLAGAGDGDMVTLILGGLESYSGNVWQDSYAWDIDVPFTDQGEAVVLSTSRACPTLTGSVWNGTQYTITWEAPAGKYHLYRSQNASGAGNGACNGRYLYLATVDTTGNSGTYVDNTTVQSWYVVIPADSSGAINGCHSEPGGPTAVTLTSFAGRVVPQGNLLTWETAQERDCLGFHLYRSLNVHELGTRLNDTIIPAEGFDHGAVYDFLDTTALSRVQYYYTLTDVDTGGSETPHGPVVLTAWRVQLPLIVARH